MTRLFTNFFDEDFKGTARFKDAVVDAYKDFRPSQLTALYVSKSGSDDNDGLSVEEPKLTINSAITDATALGVPARIDVLDAGEYTEDINIPSGITVFAIGATLKGSIVVTGGSEIYLDRHISTADSQVMVEMSADESGAAIYQSNFTDSRDHTDVIVIQNTGGGGKNFFVEVGLLYVGTDGVGITDRTSGAGHIHFYIKDLYLAGDNCVGIRSGQAGQNSTNVIGFIDHILEFGDPQTSTGILVTHSNARVNVITGEIVADVAYNVTDGELYLISPRIVGERNGVPVFELSEETFPST